MTYDSSKPPGAPVSWLRRWAVWGLGPWLAIVCLAIWTRELSAWWLFAASLFVLTGVLTGALPGRARSLARGSGLVLVFASTALGFAAHRQLGELRLDWMGYWEARESQVYAQLEAELEETLSRGERAVDELVGLVERSPDAPPAARVEELRRSSRVPAAIVFGPDGEPVVWAGTHRGRLPEAVRLGLDAYVYGELPLFSYLYFTAPVPSTGGTAVVVSLLRTDLPQALQADPGDLVSRFRARTGEEIRISTAERASDRAVYDLQWQSETLFSVSIVRPAEADRRRRVETFWVRLVGGLLLGAWTLLALSRARSREAGLAAALTLALLLAVLPWRELIGYPEFFRVENFVLAAPGTVTLGRLLALTLAGALIAGLFPFLGGGLLPLPLAGAIVAAGFPLFVGLVSEGAYAGLLAGVEREWIVYQVALAAVLSLLALAALSLGRGESAARRVWLLTSAGAVTLLLVSAAVWQVRAHATLPLWSAALWAFPAALALPAVRGWPVARRPLLLWLTAVLLGTSAALPHAWSGRVGARMEMAERQLDRLGARVDPYLQYSLERFGTVVGALYTEGASPVELLFQGWLDSGLAEEGYPVWLTLWSPGGIPREELALGVGSRTRPAVAGERLEETRQAGTAVVQRFDDPVAHYMAQVPLPDGSVVSVVVPPVRGVGAFSPMGPLFGTLAGDAPEPLKLVPLIPGDVPADGLAPRWFRTAEGWRGEVALSFPDAMVNAQVEVGLPATPILIAQATLLLAVNLLVLFPFWSVGRALATGGLPGRRWGRQLASFRARVTLALFGFFLLSNAIFGTLAFRNIAGAAERAAEVLAERVAQDAAELYLEEGRMDLLAGRVRGDLLEYRSGRLEGAAAEELVELGLYEGLLPHDVYRSLSGGRELMETRRSALGRWEYVTAFRRLADGDILAVPVPLQAGATAVRRHEVAHLLAFAIVAGAALSLGLALLVGRALTRPIRTLQVASERVGSGNLRVRLRAKRSDEFGAVFSAFNRMVRRLRKARQALIRTTRRTQAIVEDAATGVIALDRQGRVTLVNPRAEAFLGGDVVVGRRLSETAGPAGEFVRWVHLYFRDGLRETASEFQFGERRIRVRARRITAGGGPLGGAVLSLEDVTDELRTERILAWGEMARQVAHEVKNPLTPIKLSIQHIQRAWDDGRPDFDAILHRNADAMLKEIDRLAAIATSFSRFGAPSEAGASPLECVHVGDVVREVLALYGNGEGAIRFEHDVPPDLPPVRARVSEMKEVLVNLLENARAAIPRGGHVRVEGRETLGGVVLRVRDDGTGIAPELLPRIFEPHFSTRTAGTGLGLAIVKRLLESWDASVSVESEVGQGTVVHLWLRSSDGEPGAPA